MLCEHYSCMEKLILYIGEYFHFEGILMPYKGFTHGLILHSYNSGEQTHLEPGSEFTLLNWTEPETENSTLKIIFKE